MFSSGIDSSIGMRVIPLSILSKFSTFRKMPPL